SAKDPLRHVRRRPWLSGCRLALDAGRQCRGREDVSGFVRRDRHLVGSGATTKRAADRAHRRRRPAAHNNDSERALSVHLAGRGARASRRVHRARSLFAKLVDGGPRQPRLAARGVGVARFDGAGDRDGNALVLVAAPIDPRSRHARQVFQGAFLVRRFPLPGVRHAAPDDHAARGNRSAHDRDLVWISCRDRDRRVRPRGRAGRVCARCPAPPPDRSRRPHRPLARYLTWGTRALGVLVLALAVHKALAAPAAMTVATNMLFALVTGALLLHLLLSQRHGAANEKTPPLARWLRALGWLVPGVIAI